MKGPQWTWAPPVAVPGRGPTCHFLMGPSFCSLRSARYERARCLRAAPLFPQSAWPRAVSAAAFERARVRSCVQTVEPKLSLILITPACFLSAPRCWRYARSIRINVSPTNAVLTRLWKSSSGPAWEHPVSSVRTLHQTVCICLSYGAIFSVLLSIYFLWVRF